MLQKDVPTVLLIVGSEEISLCVFVGTFLRHNFGWLSQFLSQRSVLGFSMVLKLRLELGLE